MPSEQFATELLELCEECLRQASRIVHTELREFLTEKGYCASSLGWFLDALGFTALLNRTAPDKPRRRVSGEHPWPTSAAESVDFVDADRPPRSSATQPADQWIGFGAP